MYYVRSIYRKYVCRHVITYDNGQLIIKQTRLSLTIPRTVLTVCYNR